MDPEYVPHHPRLNELLAKLNLDNTTLKTVMRKMAEMMDRGLSDDVDVAASSSLKMLPSYVCSVPDGSETGDHLALDLGGTNFRVLVVRLETDRHAVQQSKVCTVPESVMIGQGTKLFDHIADCLLDFVKEHRLEKKQLPLGFTFSFPCQQDSLTKARLITWTKGYRAAGVEGNDVVGMLHDAIRRKTGSDIEVVAVLNDTVGTLMALAHEDPLCQIGVILGTGTNACYMETTERCPKMRDYLRQIGYEQMIINMEWGAFGERGELEELRTEFDRQVDRESINPGRQIFEKMISGMYLGELVRLILRKLAKEDKVIFAGKDCAGLDVRNCFTSQNVSEIVQSASGAACGRECANKARQVLKSKGIEDAFEEDCANVAYVCLLITRRSAELCGAGIATILNRMRKPTVTVGIDGSVYRYNQPHFHDFLRNQVNSLLEFSCEFVIKLSTDGSGRGAALVAAVAARLLAEGTSPVKEDNNSFCSVL